MPRKRREAFYDSIKTDIKTAARELMAEKGTAGLSTRAIAKKLDMTGPAIYHYFKSMDDLITELIFENFNALADALESARDTAAAQGKSYSEQILEVAFAYRGYGTQNPIDFQLIYGSPIPGYEAPREVTVPAARRTFEIFGMLFYQLLQSEHITPAPNYQQVPDELKPHMITLAGGETDETLLLSIYFTIVGWPQMHGIVMLELFNHIQPVVGDTDAYYRIQLINMFQMLGLEFNFEGKSS